MTMWPSLGNREPRFAIGTQFRSGGKNPQVYTVRDILKTYNGAGELVRIRYVAGRILMGQEVLDHDIVEFTIAKGMVAGGDGEGARSDEA
jgi:hypothetical protein